jgi:hypothetical protein
VRYWGLPSILSETQPFWKALLLADRGLTGVELASPTIRRSSAAAKKRSSALTRALHLQLSDIVRSAQRSMVVAMLHTIFAQDT